MRQVLLTESELLTVSTVQQHPLGFIADGVNGNTYRYAKAGGAVNAARLLALAPNVANHLNCAVPANVAVGATEITVTLGATAATKDQYQGGLLVVNAGTGKGQQFVIKGNDAGASAGSCRIVIDGALKTALASADSKVTLYPNKYNGVVESGTVAFARVGVAIRDMASGEYGWILTRGAAGVLIQGAAVAIADPVIPSTTAGAVEGIGTAAVTDQIIGFAIQAGTTTEVQGVDVRID